MAGAIKIWFSGIRVLPGKFAWRNSCENFLCFGESLWGDQFAFRYDELVENKSEAKVYWLDALVLEPRFLISSFSEFIKQDFMCLAQDPYHEMSVQAFQKFGAMNVDRHLVYSPSLLIGGEEAVENIVQMDAVQAMIVNGDIAFHLIDAQEDGVLEKVEVYMDELSRPRVKLVWRKP